MTNIDPNATITVSRKFFTTAAQRIKKIDRPTHSQLLDALASAAGFRDMNTLSAAFHTPTAMPAGEHDWMATVPGPIVRAEIHTDDQAVEVVFDATPWFHRATDDQLMALAAAQYGYDITPDSVARFFENVSGYEDLTFLFQYLQVLPERHECGYEVVVDSEQALEWLRQHRLHVAEQTLASLDADLHTLSDADRQTPKIARYRPPMIPPARPSTLHVGVIDQRDNVQVYVACSPADLDAQVAAYCRTYWSDGADRDSPPKPAGLDDAAVITAYFVGNDTEGYTKAEVAFPPQPPPA